MATEDRNVLLITSDQHSRRVAGCYGDRAVETPNIDRLASRGTTFDAASTPSPICVPARASLATGRHVHDLQTWDNDRPYTGTEAPSWGERLIEQGRRVTTIGKLHHSPETRAAAFPDQRFPIHVVDGVAIGYLREAGPRRDASRKHVVDAGPGESEYVRYDRDVAKAAEEWLTAEAASGTEPWVLHVSFVTPHMPLLAPERFFDRYNDRELPFPVDGHKEDWPVHPALDFHRRMQAHDRGFSDEQIHRATAAYYGLVSFLDEQVGRVLSALESNGFQDDTLIIYTSDHGESLGEHGLWWKGNMYEGAVGIPMIVSGPGVPENVRRNTPVSLLDIFPTLVEATGCEYRREDADLPGCSLARIANDPASVIDRPVLSQYHEGYSPSGIFMLRLGDLKYIHYVDLDPQLFDLAADPDERFDLASDPNRAADLDRARQALYDIVHPETVDAIVRSDQRRRIRARGGVERVLAGASHAYTPVPDTSS